MNSNADQVDSSSKSGSITNDSVTIPPDVDAGLDKRQREWFQLQQANDDARRAAATTSNDVLHAGPLVRKVFANLGLQTEAEELYSAWRAREDRLREASIALMNREDSVLRPRGKA